MEPAHVLVARDPAERHPGVELLDHLLCRHAPPGRGHVDVDVHRRAGHPAGDHCVDTDVGRAELVGQHARGRQERPLRDRIAALPRLGLAGHHGGHHHHRSAATPAHEGQRSPGHLQRPEDVDVHDLAPHGEIDVLEALEDVGPERVVHQDVDTAELFRSGGHQAGAGVGVHDVGRDGDGAGADARHLGQDVVEGRLAAGGQHQVGPVGCEGPRRLPAQAGADTRHHAHLPRQEPGRGGVPAPLFALRSRHGRSVGQREWRVRAIRAGVTRAWEDRRQGWTKEGHGHLFALWWRDDRRDQLPDRPRPHRREGIRADPLGSGAPPETPLRARGVQGLRDTTRRGAPSGLLHGALPGVPWPGDRLRMRQRALLRLRALPGRPLPFSRPAPGRLALSLSRSRRRARDAGGSSLTAVPQPP